MKERSPSTRFWIGYVVASVIALGAGVATRSWVVGAAIGGALVFVLAWRRIEQEQEAESHED